MSTPAPDQDFNPFSAPAVAAKVAPNQPGYHLPQYSIVRLGLQLIYYSFVGIALLMILIVAVTFVSFQIAAPGRGPMWGGMFGVMTMMGLGIFAAGIVSFTGFCMCGACPNPNEKTLAFTSIFCFLLYFGASIFGEVPLTMSRGAAGAILSAALQIIGGLASIACSITFCLLLKRIGKNISSRSMERSAQSAMIWFCILIAGTVVFAFGAGVFAAVNANGANPPTGFELGGILFALGFFIVGLGTFFKYLAMLRSGIKELNPNRNV